MIRVGGVELDPWEERIVREELLGGWRIPAEASCDGCSGGCPDTWPKWRPLEQRMPLRLACVVHDFEPRYEGGRFRSFWHRAAARWDADGRLRHNWRRLPELAPLRARFEAWSWWERWLYRVLTGAGYRALRLSGWTVDAGTCAIALLALVAFGMMGALAWWCGVVFSRVHP